MTATAILRLQDAGFTKEQVEALAGYFDEQVATKDALAATEAALRADLRNTEARLETKIEAARASTIKWVAGIVVSAGFAQGAAIIAVLKLLPGHP
jgi:hypothetical protein